jgi:23S rRNA G2445 N2-methylase RlmL
VAERRRPGKQLWKPSATLTRMFLTALPGLAPLVRRELASLPGLTVVETGFDGRADLVLVEATPEGRDALYRLRTIEDVFVEVGRTPRAAGDEARWIADRIWRPTRVREALAVWSAAWPTRSAITFRVIARVLQERSFMRTELRRRLSDAIRADKPGWQLGDPAELEVWVSEYRPGLLIAGLRLTDVRMRQHGGRRVERYGALRPAVAAAMVDLAGPPSGLLLDPCCGSGTILSEAVSAGWTVEGVDVDAGAVRAARRNVPGASVAAGDARSLDLPDASVAACVANLPFGRQHTALGGGKEWLGAVLGEIARVTRPEGRVVLLHPAIPTAIVPGQLVLRDSFELRLLGVTTRLLGFRRRR